MPAARFLLVLVLFATGCVRPTPELRRSAAAPPPVPVTMIDLEGDWEAAEFSGLTWYGDWLVFLPQYPARFAPSAPQPGEGRLFAVKRAAVDAALAGGTALTLREVPFYAPEVAARTLGFEGFEAIVFRGDSIFVTVEERSAAASMHGSIVAGVVEGDLDAVRLDVATMRALPEQTSIDNMAYEALVATPTDLVALYESNGGDRTRPPTAADITADLDSTVLIPFPSIEYRITGATELDAQGRFWAINYYWPGDSTRLHPKRDRLRPTPSRRDEGVERLVEFRLTEKGIELTGRPPITLVLDESGALRNWEGLARYGEGFLLVTDKYPRTLLGYVPLPVEE